MALTAGPLLNSVPAPQAVALTSNYLDFTGAGNDWAQQYLPDLMEKEAEVFGNRTVSGFLSQVGAEESMTSDQVVWSEQGRLHLSYEAEIRNLTAMSGTTALGTGAGGQLGIINDIDGNAMSLTHGLRVNDILLVSDAATTQRLIVMGFGATNNIVDVAVYNDATGAATLTGAGFTVAATVAGTTPTITVLVFGSEWGKGVDGQAGNAVGPGVANQPTHQSFDNKPIIIKDHYHINGSDTSAIGWVEVSGEDGANGYLWYLKAEGETRMRFTDYLEMTMVESEIGNTAAAFTADNALSGAGNAYGTEGLFAAVMSRGNQASLIDGSLGAPADLAEFDLILNEFDNQGSIEENMIFGNRLTSLSIDNMLASVNAHYGLGTSYGVFNNSEDMALNLGFSGFRRGSYDFYKTDWKYLNDKATRGAINARDLVGAVRGVFIPAGVSSVYDQILGKNLKRPFLHVRYRASQTDNRKMKTWTTGSVGGNITSDLDAMQVHYLSERCLITQGANNFVLLT